MLVPPSSTTGHIGRTDLREPGVQRDAGDVEGLEHHLDDLASDGIL